MPQQVIASGMTVAVIHLLEVVEVEHDHSGAEVLREQGSLLLVSSSIWLGGTRESTIHYQQGLGWVKAWLGSRLEQ